MILMHLADFVRPATDPTNLAGLVRAPGRHVAAPTQAANVAEYVAEHHGQRRAPGRHVAEERAA